MAISQDTSCTNSTATSGSKFYAYYGIGVSEAFRLFLYGWHNPHVQG